MTASGAVLQHPSEAALHIGEKRETFCWCFKVTLKVANFFALQEKLGSGFSIAVKAPV